MLRSETVAVPVMREPGSRLAALVSIAPFALLTWWIAAVAAHASIVMNGTRWFYLDDVQMIAMRYARNFARGNGLVWNAGERVEGYSNPAWVLVMAAVHAAGAPDRLAPLAIKAVAWLLACLVLILAVRLRRMLAGPNAWADLALLSMLAVNADVVFWAANGFETPLLTAVLLWLLTRVLAESERNGATPLTLLASGALATIRSDGHLLVAAVITTAVVLSPRPWKTARMATLALLLPILHVMVRRAYYGEWLPNTYYVRLWHVPDSWIDGLRYARGFVVQHVLIVALAVAATALPKAARARALLGVCAAAGVHGILAGGDVFEHHRFVAPAVPVMLVLAMLTLDRLTMCGPSAARPIAAATLVGYAALTGGMVSRWPVDAMRSWRGKPWQGVVIGHLLQEHTSADATVATASPGSLGYFSRRTVFDLTGRTDPAIARLAGRQGADAAARKYDIDRSLARRPDFVVIGAPHEAARLGPVMFALLGVDIERDIGPALVSNRTFLAGYAENPVAVPLLMERCAVYVREDSPERPRVSAMPALSVGDFR